MKQWMFKITAYADRLLEDLDLVDWPTGTLVMQKEWIGKSFGAEVDFEIQGHDEALTVFTTRPDTLYGATYMVIAPEKEIVQRITTAEHQTQVLDYIERSIRKSERDRVADTKEKTGVFTGAYAINPVTKTPIPIWISDYVLSVAEPERSWPSPDMIKEDWDFATAFGINIIEVIDGGDISQAAHTGEGHPCQQWSAQWSKRQSSKSGHDRTVGSRKYRKRYSEFQIA